MDRSYAKHATTIHQKKKKREQLLVTLNVKIIQGLHMTSKPIDVLDNTMALRVNLR